MKSGRIALIALPLAFFALPVGASDRALPLASQHPMGVSSTWTPDEPKASQSDNSGRQIAIFSSPFESQVNHPAVPPRGRSKHPIHTPPSSKGWQKITISVPRSLDDAADYCDVNARQLEKIGAQKFFEFSRWFNNFVKSQNNLAPTITPAASAYSIPVRAVGIDHRLWYLRDGRLKTVTNR